MDNLIVKNFVPISLSAFSISIVCNYFTIWLIDIGLNSYNFAYVGDGIFVLYSIFALKVIHNYLKNTKDGEALIKMSISIRFYIEVYTVIFGLSIVSNNFELFQNSLPPQLLTWFIISYVISLIITLLTKSEIEYKKEMLAFGKQTI